MVVLVVLHHVWLVVTPWTVAHQVPLSMEFSRQEYWSRLSFRTPGNLPHQKDMRRCGPNPHFLCHQVDSLPFVPPGEEGHETCLVCCILSHSVGSNSLKPMDCRPPGPSENRDSPGKNTGVSCHALLQEILPTQGSNLGVLRCRRITV